MSRKPFALVAAGLGAAAGLYLLWHALEERPAESPSAQRAAEVGPAGETEPRAGTALDAPERPVEEAARSTAGAETSAEELAARTESFEPESALWIAGSVRFPAGSPPDETLEVWAFEEEIAEGLAESVNDLPSTVRRGRLEKGWWSRRPVEGNGSFRVPVPEGTSRAAVLLDGRFLYLEQAARVDVTARSEPLELTPRLGTWLVGRCTLPLAAEPADSPAGALVSFEGYRIASSSDLPGDSCERSTVVGPDLAFEIRGVATGMQSSLSVSPTRLMTASQESLVLNPGTKREIEIALHFGARVHGQVVDESGAGLAKADVELANAAGGFLSGWLIPTEDGVRTAQDGGFELFGIPPGKTRVRAELDGYVDGLTEALDLRDGDVRRGITIVLSRGRRVAGRVTWPDGSPAPGARVTAVEKAEAGAKNPDLMAAMMGGPRERRTATAGAQGEFTISGLDSGSISLRATARRALGEPPPGRTNEPGENLSRWSAALPEVAVDSLDCLMVLKPPVGLEGRVVDDLEAPVRAFAISARVAVDARERDIFGSHVQTQTFEAPDGSFLLTGLEEGAWTIEVEAEGYLQSGEKPVVTVPRTEGPLLLRVARAGSAAGVVLDPDGRPLAGADIAASQGARRFFGAGAESEPATSDDKGAFTVENLPVGNVLLTASSDHHASSDPLPVGIVPGGRLEGLVLQLRRGGRLTGEVYDSRGGRAAGRTVQTTSMGGGEDRGAVVDDAGLFAIEGLSPGTYQVILEPSQADQERMAKSAMENGEMPDVAEFLASMKMTSAQIREGETTHVVLGAPPKAPVRLFGRVTRGGEPVRKGIIVSVGEGGSVLSKLKMANVRESGDYEMTLDEPGDVLLSFRDDVSSGGGAEFGVTVPEATEFRFDLELPVGGIRGTVRGTDGCGLEDVGVSLIRGGSLASFSRMDETGEHTTDSDGRFEFQGLAAGTYAVAAGGKTFEQAMTEHGTVISDDNPRYGRAVRAGLVVEKDRVLEGVELRLSAPGRVSGLVRDAAGAPIADATVFARDERGEVLHRFSTCATDADGRFTYAGVAPGSYTLFVRTQALASPESAAIHVREGETAQIELTALPGTTLRVSLEDGEGRRLRGSFSVRNERGHEVGGLHGMESVESLFTEGISSSEQRFGPLPAGEYKVTATATDGRSASKPVTLRGQEERSLKLRVE